ncbi:ABC transporter ATP-binding protein [Tessaracoccus sp. OH4464_COT-324]|uniref:ABC transporter ATP-binding protein n=1 Tax=Tessaracoccus sp. OH4464_COT-324 TaxID=2491059 RepID=UPI001319E42E|nr:ABC transporter ATP-binding protein [Tessaracoccus sp. OH4464_COT-324]
MFSEHHLLLLTGTASVDYKPGADGAVVGLAKLAQPVRVFARHAQVQERLTAQETHAFAASLRDNVALRRPAADAELLRALARVGADWATDLDALVGGDTTQLTTAQKQELSLARALVANPDVVIFDESFSALDSLGKGNLEAGVFDLMPDSTVLVIAHQLGMVSADTRVIVMDDGRIVEDGSHEHLLAAAGPYARLWRSWRAQPAPG